MGNISLKKRIEELELKEARYLDLVQEIIVTINIEGIVTFINRKGCELLGYPKNLILGKNWFDNFIPKENRSVVKEIFKNILRGKIEQIEYYENPIISNSNERTIISWHNTNIKDEEGNITHTLSTGIDITKQKKYEEDLNTRNKILKIFLTNDEENAFAKVLDLILENMESKHGIFGYIDENGDLNCPSLSKEVWDICKMPDKNDIFHRESWEGIWKESLIGKIGLYSNKEFEVPSGHIDIKNAIICPILFYDEIIGLLMVGNKDIPYNNNDQEVLRTFAQHLSPILNDWMQLQKEDKIREQVENELKENQMIFQLIDSQPFIGITIVQDNEFKYMNDAFINIMEYSEEEMRTWSIERMIKVIHPEDRENVYNQLKAKLRGDKVTSIPHYSFRLNSKSGAVKQIKIFSKTVRYKNDLADYVILIDETDKFLYEKQLRDSEEKFRMVSEQSSSGIFIIQKDEIKFVNKGAEDILGYTKNEIMQWTPLEYAKIIHPDYIDYAMKRMGEKQNNDNGNVSDFTLKAIVKNGEQKWIETYSKKIKFEDDPALLVTIIDVTKRKKIENDLIESEEKFRKIFENGPMGMFVINQKMEFVQVNNVFANILEYTVSELAGMKIIDIIHPDDLSNVLTMGHALMNMQIPKGSFEIRSINKSGQTLFLTITVSLLSNPRIEEKLIAAIIEDITAQKNAEKALREGEERFRTIFEASPSVMAIIDKNLNFIQVNDIFYELSGYTESDLDKITLLNILHPDDAKEDIEAIQLFFEGNIKNIKLERRAFTKTGELIYIAISVSLLKDLSINSKFMIAIIEDITARKDAEKALQENEERYRQLVENMNDGLIVINENNIITYFNPQMSYMTGYSQNELLNHNVFDFFDRNNREILEQQLDLRRKGVSNTYEIEWIKRDESSLPILINPHAIYNEDGEFEGSFGIIRDISNEKRMESERLKSQKLESLSILTGGIAHDFNNYLNAIIGGISVLKLKLTKENGKNEILDEIESAALKTKSLTKQLQTFSIGGTPLNLDITSIKDILEETVNFNLRGSNVLAKFDIPDLVWSVEIDSDQISQVITNITINAKQAMPNGGTFEIAVNNSKNDITKSNLPLKEEYYIEICFTDMGIGIPEKNIGKVFDPYFTTKENGAGLGLSTSFSIVKKHKGIITVESEVGVGSTFKVYLPAEEIYVFREEQEEEIIDEGVGKILIMDDQESNQFIIGTMLKDLGFETEMSDNGEEMLLKYKKAMINDEKYDLVIMDLTIPGGMGGKEAIIALLKMDPSAKAIVSSGYSNEPIIDNFYQYGFIDALTKPYTITDLSRILKKHVVPKEDSKNDSNFR